MIDFSGVSLPFNVGDLIGSGNALLGLVGGFVLLALAFGFSKEIMWTIRTAFFTHRSFSSYNKEYGEKFDKKTIKDTIKSTYESGKYKNWGR